MSAMNNREVVERINEIVNEPVLFYLNGRVGIYANAARTLLEWMEETIIFNDDGADPFTEELNSQTTIDDYDLNPPLMGYED